MQKGGGSSKNKMGTKGPKFMPPDVSSGDFLPPDVEMVKSPPVEDTDMAGFFNFDLLEAALPLEEEAMEPPPTQPTLSQPRVTASLRCL